MSLKYTVKLVIFAGLNFREFAILGLLRGLELVNYRMIGSPNIIIIFARFLNLRMCPPRGIRQK